MAEKVTDKQPTPNKRNKRWDESRRGKPKPTEHLNIGTLPFYQSKIYPDKTEPLGLDIEFVKDKRTNKMLPAWVALSLKLHSRKLRQLNLPSECVYHTKVYHRLESIDLMTRY